MAQILNTQLASQALASNSQVSVDAALSKLNGQMAVLQTSASGNSQLVLNGKPIPLPKIPQTITKPATNQTVQLKIKEQATQTFLEIVKPGNTPQSLQLTPSQGQQLMGVIGQNPNILTNYASATVDARVMKALGDQLVLQVNGKAITLTVANASARFNEGQMISLKLLNKNDQWQVEIKNPSNRGANGQLIQPNQRQLTQLLEATLPKNLPIALDNQDKGAHLNIQRILPSALQTSFKGDMQNLPVISIDKHHQIKLQWTQSEQLIAKLPLEGNLKQKTLEMAATIAAGATKQDITGAGIAKSNNPSSVNRELSLEMLAGAAKNLEPQANRQVIINQADAAKIRSDLQPLMRVLQAKTDSPSALMNSLDKSLGTLSIAIDSPINEFVSEMSKLINNDKVSQSNGQILPQDIKQLLTASPLPVTPATITNPPQQANFLAGLMGMLQVSLAARLARKQPEHLDKLTQMILPSLMSNVAKADGKKQVGKGLSDFLQADGKFQILKNLDKLLSGHQYNKLSSMETQLQGQDSLYHVIPIGDNGQRKDVEILVKRELEQDNQTDKAKGKGTYWALTMKLPVGDIGQILAKAKVNGNNLDLDFYTSNDKTKELVFNFIPILKKRFEQLGIDMGQCQCQLGKIPDSLQDRPYHIFEAKA